MYLKSIRIENVGPIHTLRIDLPFRDSLPQPLVLVGPNGSGKSTLLSFIVNALVVFKQQVFDQTEVEQDRVYRLRGPIFIRRGTCWYHAKLEFEQGLSLEEWALDRPRQRFEAEVRPLPSDESWKQVNEDETDFFQMTPQPQHAIRRIVSKPIQKLLEENVVLFFPSDRFELPDWLNERSLSADLRFPDPIPFKGQTARKIFSRALLRPTLEWIKAVSLDALLLASVPPPFNAPSRGNTVTPDPMNWGGREGRIVSFVGKVLARVLNADTDNIQFQFDHRNVGRIAATFERRGWIESIPNLLGLSAGQAALFCIFCNLIRDFDLAGTQFNDISDVRGIVILDEADLHLHVDLQYRILPELMKIFPRVQFVVTAHSPLFVMGMEKAFGDDGFRVIDMPSGEAIETEAFSEFGHAFSAFTRTRTFDQRVLDQIRRATRPVVIVEGKSDVTHLQTAWEKLYLDRPIPWDIVPSGGFSTKESRGGADMLRTMIRACCLHLERTALGLFDHDREGMEQFNGLQADGFVEATERAHWKHTQQPVHSLLLPVPPGRENFVSAKAKSCFLSIEHYYSDDLLGQYGLADDPVVADSVVFSITSDSKKKGRFVDALPSLDKAEFRSFSPLFDRLAQILGIQPDQLPSSLLPEGQCRSTGFNLDGTTLQMPVESPFAQITVNTNDSKIISESETENTPENKQ